MRSHPGSCFIEPLFVLHGAAVTLTLWLEPYTKSASPPAALLLKTSSVCRCDIHSSTFLPKRHRLCTLQCRTEETDQDFYSALPPNPKSCSHKLSKSKKSTSWRSERWAFGKFFSRKSSSAWKSLENSTRCRERGALLVTLSPANTGRASQCSRNSRGEDLEGKTTEHTPKHECATPALQSPH